MNLFTKEGTLKCFLFFFCLSVATSLHAATYDKNDTNDYQQDFEEIESENLDLPPWLVFAQLLSDRLEVSENMLHGLQESLKNSSETLQQIHEILLLRQDSTDCSEKTGSKDGIVAENEMSIPSELPTLSQKVENKSIPSVESATKKNQAIIQQMTEESTKKITDENSEERSSPSSSSSVHPKIQQIRNQIQTILKKLKAKKDKKDIDSEIHPDCQDTRFILGCRSFRADPSQLCQDDIHWKLCCRSCVYAYISHVLN